MVIDWKLALAVLRLDSTLAGGRGVDNHIVQRLLKRNISLLWAVSPDICLCQPSDRT